MFNTNSPIVNNMMLSGQGGVYPNGYIPPNPISNMMPIGNNGYNNNVNGMGGYYNNNYNNYYNPYLAAQQEQIRQAQLQEQQRAQSDIWKSISRSVNTAIGNDIQDWDSHLKQYDPQDVRQQQMDPEDAITQRLLNVHYNGVEGNLANMRYIQANNSHYEQVKQQYPDDISMLEFSERFSDIYIDVLNDKEKESRKNLTQLYDRNGYNQLIRQQSTNNNYFGSTFQNNPQGNNNVSIDDMEVRLPNHLQNEYQSRKQAFLDAILNKG